MKKCIIFLAGFALLLAGCPRVGGEGAKSYTVKFSATPAEGGSLTAKVKNGAAFTSGKTVLAETVLEFTATPKDGYKVEKWAGVTANPKDNTKATLKVTKDADVKVFFVKNSTEPSEPPADEKYTVTFSHTPNTPNEGGSLTAKIKGGAAFTSGSKVPVNTVLEFTATPKDGYKVKKWEGVTADPKDNTKATLTVTGNAEVKAVFEAVYTVNFSAEPSADGEITAKVKDSGAAVTNGSKVPANTMLEFTATPKDGFIVDKWDGIPAEPVNAKTVTASVDKPLTVKVIFKAKPAPADLVTVTVVPSEHGSVITNLALIEGTKGEKDTEMTFTAKPAIGYLVNVWTVTGGQTTAGGQTGDTTATVKLTANTTVTVTFKEKPVKVTFTAESNGTLKAEVDGSAINTGDAVDKGKTVTFTAEPHKGYGVDSWEISGGTFETGGQAEDTTATVNLSADTTVKVRFKYTGVYNLDGITFTMKTIPAVTDTQLIDGHTVSLSTYTIGETEVTNKLYKKVLSEGADDIKPKSNITWFTCIAFCNRLTEQIYGSSECVYYSDAECSTVYQKTDADATKRPFMNIQKKGFRLPTEAEWMYAAKGGQSGPFAGSEKAQLGEIAWYSGNSGSNKQFVKTKASNGYGLYDMCGNILEWCWNDADSTPAQSLSGQDPTGKDDEYAAKRILKGGSFNHPYGTAAPESSALNLMNSDKLPAISEHATSGFRIVCRPF